MHSPAGESQSWGCAAIRSRGDHRSCLKRFSSVGGRTFRKTEISLHHMLSPLRLACAFATTSGGRTSKLCMWSEKTVCRAMEAIAGDQGDTSRQSGYRLRRRQPACGDFLVARQSFRHRTTRGSVAATLSDALASVPGLVVLDFFGGDGGGWR